MLNAKQEIRNTNFQKFFNPTLTQILAKVSIQYTRQLTQVFQQSKENNRLKIII